jgi:predicted outer membrane repeat protein
MFHSQDRTTRRESTGRSVTRVSIMLTLLAMCALAIAAVSVSSHSVSARPASSVATEGRAERSNPRVSGRRANASRLAPTATAMSLLVSITVDRTDDVPSASACTAAANDCSLRGAIEFANVNAATTVNVPAGTYQLNIPGGAVEGFNGDNTIGDLDVRNSSTSIIGAGAATTIIQQTQPNDRVIEVNPFLDANFSFTISGVTISGGSETTAVGGGGIISGSIDNSVTVTNCTFSGNSATGAGSLGGGGIAHTGGNLTVSGTTFSGNSSTSSGGAISYSAGDPFARTPSTGILTVSGSTFTNNSSSSAAAGGGALDLFNYNSGTGSYSVDTSSFSSNNASAGSGGAINVESGGPLTVTTSSFATNNASTSGGAIFSNATSGSVTYSRLVNNTAPNGRAIFRNSGTLTANDDWWGINAGPAPGDFSSPAGDVTPSTWLQLRASASPNTICVGGTSTITADIKQRNTGPALTVELNGLPPFPATFVNTTPAVGTLSAVSANFVNGEATATFTGTAPGTANIDVIADNQTVTASVIVQNDATTDPADQTVCEGATATFTTNSSGAGNFTYVWKKGATVLNNGDLGGRVTITSGTNTSTLSISNVQSSDADTYTVEATGSCSTVTQTATLTVNQATSTTDPADVTVCQGATANFSTTASGTGPFSYAWTLDGVPYNGNNPSINIDTTSLSSGPHTVVVTTTGACGSASQTAILTVGNPPVITIGTSNINVWPPNHAYQTFTASDFGATASGCDGDLTSSIVIASVTSDEPEDSLTGADGTTLNDIVIAADCKSVQLRRERDADLNGRVYTITFKVTDSGGNTTTATATVRVPISQGNGSAINGPGPGYTVTSACP